MDGVVETETGTEKLPFHLFLVTRLTEIGEGIHALGRLNPERKRKTRERELLADTLLTLDVGLRQIDNYRDPEDVKESARMFLRDSLCEQLRASYVENGFKWPAMGIAR